MHLLLRRLRQRAAHCERRQLAPEARLHRRQGRVQRRVARGSSLREAQGFRRFQAVLGGERVQRGVARGRSLCEAHRAGGREVRQAAPGVRARARLAPRARTAHSGFVFRICSYFPQSRICL
jgi:hypothetical protein